MSTNNLFQQVPKRDAARGLSGTGRAKARRRGAALVEFAMIAMLFFTILLGLIQFGIYQSTTNTLWNLSREGARFASVGDPTDAQIKARVREIAPPNINKSKLEITLTPVNPQSDPPIPRASGSSVEVSLTYDMKDKLIFPLINPLFAKKRTVTPGIPATPSATAIPAETVTEYKYSTRTTMRVE